MPSDQAKTLPNTASITSASSLPPLQSVKQIDRPLSMPEYYHACVGRSARTLEVNRENGFVLRGEGRISAAQWQDALAKVASTNPGARLRLVGRRQRARWLSDGQFPALRIIEDCTWDGFSSEGSEFLYETELSLENGPTVELVVMHQANNRMMLLLRSHHAVMDGMGCFHFLQELFRALRGEALLGTNVAYSDVDLMESVDAEPAEKQKPVPVVALTGEPRGEQKGDDWRRVYSGAPQKNLLGKVAAAMTEFMHQHTDGPAVIAVPVDLRRHMPGLLSTGNYTSMLRVRLEKGATAEDFKTQLQAMIATRKETVYLRIFNLFKWLPFTGLDLMLSRTEKNYRNKKPLESLVISNIGRNRSEDFSCDGFRMDGLLAIPLAGSVFAVMAGVDDRVEVLMNIPRILSSEGRFDALEAHLNKRLSDSSMTAS